MGNYPYLDINFGEIEVAKDYRICFETHQDKLKVFQIESSLNFPVYNFIQLINKILIKFYKKEIKNFKAFIISLDNLLEFYFNEEEIKEANNILENSSLQENGGLVNLREKVKLFQNLYNNLEKINKKEKKNFIKSIKTILEEDRVLNVEEINSFIELLTQIFDKNIFEGKNSNIIEKKKFKIFNEKDSNIFGRNQSNIIEEKNSIIFDEENAPTQDFDDARIEELSNLSYNSNFSSYSKSSQHQIRKMEKEIKRLKKLIPKNN